MSLETGLLLAIGVLQTVSTAAFVAGVWKRGREAAEETLAERIVAIQTRLDHAGQEMSDLADKVQTLETQLRREFVSLERCMERMQTWLPTRPGARKSPE